MSAEAPSDICWPDLAEHVNHFLHRPSRRPETGATCACMCFYTQRGRINSGLERGRLIRQTKTPTEVKQLIATAGAN